MATKKIDDNRVKTIAGLLNTNGATVTNITIDPTTHILDVANDTTGTDQGGGTQRDDNRSPMLYALSSVDGTTLKVLYVDSSGKLLIDST